MMFTLYLGFSALSIILDLVFFTFLVVLEETESFPGIIGLLGVVWASLVWGFNINPFTVIIAHPLIVVGAFFVYFAFGVIWSTFSWWLYAKSMQPRIDREWTGFKNTATFKDKPIDEVKKAFLASSAYNPLYRSGISLSNENNWKIVNWIVMWPVSVVWRLIRSLTIDLGKLLLSIFGRFYDSITNSITNKLN